MWVSVRGAKDKELTKWLKIAAKYFAKQLIKPRLYEKLELNIQILKYADLSELKADCMWDDMTPPPSPTIFNIRLAKEGIKDEHFYFKALAHEMVHVKQFATNQLDGIFGKGYTHKWKGPSFKIPSKRSPKTDIYSRVKLDKNDRDYYFQPWEVEAYGLEVGLVYYFVEDYKKDLPYGRYQGDWD